jgi:hypothetical protein
MPEIPENPMFMIAQLSYGNGNYRIAIMAL